MNWIQKIFNTEIRIPEPNGVYIEKWEGYEKQKWHRKELPASLDDIKMEKGKSVILDEQQKSYIKEEKISK